MEPTDEQQGPMSAVQQSISSSLTDAVAEKLGRFIAEGHMAPGDPLPSEESLSETFAVSKRVVREALRALAAQGIVRTSQGKKAVVGGARPVGMEAYFRFMHHLDGDSILELYELREIIEVHATVLAAKRATTEDLDRISRALANMEAAGKSLAARAAADLAFHNALIDAAHNRFLSAVVSALSGSLREEREIGMWEPADGDGAGPGRSRSTVPFWTPFKGKTATTQSGR